jgi:hypothetical protein
MLLKKLYSTIELEQAWRIAHFAYSTPSVLLVGDKSQPHLTSSNGVRQGDPLSTLLFSLAIHDTYDSVAKSAAVTLYGFVDDLQIIGTPDEVMKAFKHLQNILGPTGLTINNSKCTFAWFHQGTHSLDDSITASLHESNIPIAYDHFLVLGAVLGRNIEQITIGLREFITSYTNDPFFSRIINPKLSVQKAMLLFRYCGVPRMSYLLRVTPPAAIKRLAVEFDLTVLSKVKTLLDLDGQIKEDIDDMLTQVHEPLRYGGFGMTKAATTSHHAYIASVASASAMTVFAIHAVKSTTSILHDQLTESIHAIRSTTPKADKLLPKDASSFFTHYTNSTTISSLQHELQSLAASHRFLAALTNAIGIKDTYTVSRMRCISAQHASDWKAAIPSNSDLTLTDDQYRIAAKMNLGINIPLPDDCFSCNCKDAVKNDNGHFMSCNHHKRREITIRHNLVLSVLHRLINYVGGVAVREPIDLHDSDGRRPDLQLILRSLHALVDVMITNPLCPSHLIASSKEALSSVRRGERIKTNKYKDTASQHLAKFIPFVMESTGGLGDSAVSLLNQIILTSRDNNTLVEWKQVARECFWLVGIANQKGNAMTMIAGRNKAIGRATGCPAA